MEKEQNDDENPVKSSLDMYIYEYSQISKELQIGKILNFCRSNGFTKLYLHNILIHVQNVPVFGFV